MLTIIAVSAAVAGGYVVLSYAAGLGLYYVAGLKDHDASGDAFIPVVLLAPVGLPLWGYCIAKDWRANRKHRESQKKV